MFDTFATMLPLHRTGKIRILGYAYNARAPIAPDVPTMIEAGVKDYEAYTFNVILGPANMPKPIVDALDQASRKLMADADMVKFLNDVARRADARHHTGAHREVHHRRDRQVGAGHQGCRRQGRIAPIGSAAAPASCVRRPSMPKYAQYEARESSKENSQR